jgi:hypothetical protein
VLSRITGKNLHTWARGYARHLVRRAAARAGAAAGPRHLLFALCDHYEPLWGKTDEVTGHTRVAAWAERYPALGRFRDADGRPPRHSWFFPGEEYRPAFLEPLATLARAGLGEVEVHLHHDGDTRDTLRAKLEETLRLLGGHGHLSRDAAGRFRWAFIHGNWCLANGRPDRRWCGVDDELPLLHEMGCYADYTFPSAPDPCQSDMVNLIYWPSGDLARRRSYDDGEPARVGASHDDRLLLITGPLALSRKGRVGIRIENGALTGDDPPTAERVRAWVDQEIHVAGRPSGSSSRSTPTARSRRPRPRCSATAGSRSTRPWRASSTTAPAGGCTTSPRARCTTSRAPRWTARAATRRRGSTTTSPRLPSVSCDLATALPRSPAPAPPPARRRVPRLLGQ